MAFTFRNTSLSEARAKAQEALSTARRCTDPDVKRQWERLASAWRERIEALEGDAASVQPIIPPLNGGTDRRN